MARICKEWSGALQEGLTDADNFGVAFEPAADLHAEEKALLLAAVFLIDFMYFEDNEPAKNNDGARGRAGRGLSAFDMARQLANT